MKFLAIYRPSRGTQAGDAAALTTDSIPSNAARLSRKRNKQSSLGGQSNAAVRKKQPTTQPIEGKNAEKRQLKSAGLLPRQAKGDSKRGLDKKMESSIVTEKQSTAAQPVKRQNPPFSPLYKRGFHGELGTSKKMVAGDVIFQPRVSREEYDQWVPPNHGSEAQFLQIQRDLGVAVGGFMYYYSDVTSTLQLLNITTHTWSTMPLPDGIAETHQAVAYDHRSKHLYVVSGQKGGACLPAVPTAARIDLDRNVVEYLPDLPKARYGANAAILRSSSDPRESFLHVWGGGDGETRVGVALDHWRLRISSSIGKGTKMDQHWERMESPPDAGTHGVAKVFGNSIYYTAFCVRDFAKFGKADMKGCRKHDFEVGDAHHVPRNGLAFKYDERTSKWERLEDMPLALCHTGPIIFEDKLYLFGGLQSQITYANGGLDVETFSQVFDFASETWSVLSNLTEPVSNPYVWIDDNGKEAATVSLMRPHEYFKRGKKRPYSNLIRGKFDAAATTPKNIDFVFALKTANRRKNTERLLECLRPPRQSSDIVTEADCHPFWAPSYNNLRNSWNHYYKQMQQPNVVCKPMNESQVSAIVNCARRGGHAVCGRSGKHSFSGDTCTYGIVVDVTNFKDIAPLNEDKTQWRMGAGNTLGRVSMELHNSGCVLPAGHCPSVGLTGLIMAGGQGPLSRLYGMTSDFVAKVRYVNWEGKIVEATSSNQMKDALWLARGGGSGVYAFPGIITEWQFQDIPKLIVQDAKQPVFTTLTMDVEPTLDNVEYLMERYQDFLLDEKLVKDPYFDHLTVEVWIANWMKMPEDTRKEKRGLKTGSHRKLKVVAYFYGDDRMHQHAEEHFFPKIKEFASSDQKIDLLRQPYLEFQRTIGGVKNNEEFVSGNHGWNLGDKWKGYSAVASDKIPGKVFRDLAIGMWETEPLTMRYTEFKPLRGHISTNMGKSDSAFWHRDALFWSLSSHFWRAPESSQHVQSILDASSKTHRRYEAGLGESFAGSYNGYMDPSLTLSEDLERFNGGNAAKVSTVRNLLDPSNVFRHYLPNHQLSLNPAISNILPQRQQRTLLAQKKIPAIRKTFPIITLLRSIGNAVPPRHMPEQTLNNLNFTLSWEESFPDVAKHWLVNRLVNSTVERQVIELLETYNQKYTVLPFNLTEYSTKEYAWDIGHDNGDFVHSISVLGEENQGRFHQEKSDKLLLDAIEIHKNNYVTNVNGGRNRMLDIGLAYGTDWILPLDGNCFFTGDAFDGLRSGILSNKESRYMMVPMKRVIGSNELYFAEAGDHSEKELAQEEPQLVFRKDASARFNPNLWYSRRDKMELLSRLNATGPWLNFTWSPWEHHSLDIMKPIEDKPSWVPSVGYVYRLDSGRADLEVGSKVTSREMMTAREVGVSTLLSQLDERVIRDLYDFNSSDLVILNQLDARVDFEGETEGVLIESVTSVPCPDVINATEFISKWASLYAGSGNDELLGATTSCVQEAFGRAVLGTNKKKLFMQLFRSETLPHLLDVIRILIHRGKLSPEAAAKICDFLEKYLAWLENSKYGKERFKSCGSDGARYDVHAVTVAGFLDKVQKLVWYLDRSKSRLLLVGEGGRLPVHCDDGNSKERLMGWSLLAQLSQTYGRSNLWAAYPSDSGETALCRMTAYYLDSNSTERDAAFHHAANDLARNCPHYYQKGAKTASH